MRQWNKVICSCITILHLSIATAETPNTLSTIKNSHLLGIQDSLNIKKLKIQQDKIQMPGLDNSKINLILDLDKLKASTTTEGPRTGGGGNSCALVVQAATEKLKVEIQLDALKDVIKSSEQTRLLEVMQNAKFYTAEKLFLNGERKDAINYPSQQSVALDSYFCDYKLSEGSAQSLALLLHEYLGLARVNDTKYQVSQFFLERYRKVAFERNRFNLMALNELKNDEFGKNSCFDGKVLDAKNTLKADDGRIGDFNFDYDIMEIYKEEPRYMLVKYATFYDRNGQQTNYSDGAIGITSLTSTRIFMVTAKHTSTTTGSYFTSNKAFQIQIDEEKKVQFKVDFKSETSTSDEKEFKPSYSFKCKALQDFAF